VTTDETGKAKGRDTRTRILDAAEKLFAEQGLASTSLRQITREAGVNLAAVNYHFGSREQLIHEVFARLVGPVNRERLACLDERRAAAGDAPLPLATILECLAAPALRRGGDRLRMRLAARVLSEPGVYSPTDFHRLFEEIAERFLGELARTLPDLPPAEIAWRFHFFIGALLQALHGLAGVKGMPGPFSELYRVPVEEVLRRVVAFGIGGFLAPAVPGNTGEDGP